LDNTFMTESLLLLAAAPSFAVLGFGFLIGLKHATEADHLAAVSTIVAERKSVWSSALIGGFWGLGHTVSLFLAGVLVLVLDFQISAAAERRLELGVGIMLSLLGLNVLRKLLKGGMVHFHTHEHGGRVHAHPHLHEPAEAADPATHHNYRLNTRAVLIGMMHGLAGSGALMLLVIPTIESRALGMVYVTIFGIGSIGGMMLMSFLVGLPFHLTASRFNSFNRLLQAGAGCVSVILGLWIVYEIGFSIST
jgi:ABC-type nickel/cobalt efflux system permease component RcnA